MKGILLFIFGLLNFSLFGQNLLHNPSFEDYHECPKDYSRLDNEYVEIIPFWSNPTKGTADYFNKCAKGNVSVPSNFAGDSNPLSGNGYLGLVLCGSDKDYREYAEGKLIKKLIKNEDYLVKLNYKLASLSKYSVNQLGIYMSVDSIHRNINNELKFLPQLKWNSDIANDWTQLQGLYSASGGEEYIIIGNFNDSISNVLTTIFKDISNRRGKEYSYYYFDDLSIEAVPSIKISNLINDSLSVNLIDTSGEIFQFNRSVENSISLISTNINYEFSLADLQIDYFLIDNYKLRLKCKNFSKCIKCNARSNLSVLPALNLIFGDQKDAVLFYNKIKR